MDALEWRVRRIGRSAGRVLALLVAVAGLLVASTAQAITVVYDFEPPQFASGEASPMLAKAPNPSSNFRADFGNAAVANAFIVAGGFIPNPLFSGAAFIDRDDPPSSIRLSFNVPVIRLQLNFAVEQSGRLDVVSALGTVSQVSADVGGQFEGGTLELLAPAGVTTVQIAAFHDDGEPGLWAMDNLRLDLIPEPAVSLCLLAAACAALCRRSRRRSVPGW